MQHHSRRAVLTLILSVAAVAAQCSASGADQPAQKSARPKLYDTSADGKEQIALALKTAKAEDKRVLVKFGANW